MVRGKILLADDDPEDRSIIQDAMALLNAGEVMCFANNGNHALELLEATYRDNTLPNLIVLDLNMPRLSGTQTLHKIKQDQRFQHIPVIIYSTSINPLEKENCLALGAQAYITKPVSFQESLETAKKFMAFCESVISA